MRRWWKAWGRWWVAGIVFYALLWAASEHPKAFFGGMVGGFVGASIAARGR